MMEILCEDAEEIKQAIFASTIATIGKCQRDDLHGIINNTNLPVAEMLES